ncbi:hypothetical protein GCM10009721_39320 [Terrabacter tumescens]|uniref:Phosphoglycolate phosphatase n=1 Tax=Terrabacter tumescens TaxID=60443 RepID=A0ABQ2IGM0_9MICO|nr:HAD family hydrolase [Terrabacter tumescens]GGN07841.1 hypothetical protein GCM10009721_39320 [Terrabacter tumescens]
MADRPRPKLLITDLDNTLWDWFDAWYQSFSGMLEELCELSGVEQDVLERQIRAVHQARGTTEYSNLVNEVPALVAAAAPDAPAVAFNEALHVLNSRRKSVTKLYPGVRESLASLKNAGVRVVAYTESGAFWTEWRMRHTGLDGVIDVLYSAPDHDLPDGMRPEDLRTGHLPPSAYGLKVTKHHHVPRGVYKPSEDVLRSILEDQGCQPSEAVYVGDSLMKDIAMARATGVLDVHAAYGQVQKRPEYGLLQRVSNWPDEDVERERALARDSAAIIPTISCAERFDEVLSVFDVALASAQ